MDEDRAGSNTPIGTERRVEARMGLFGFYAAITVDIALPWMPTPSALQALIDRAREAETTAKPVGSVPRSPDSPH